jgi:hypothetical protein
MAKVKVLLTDGVTITIKGPPEKVVEYMNKISTQRRTKKEKPDDKDDNTGDNTA